MIIEIPNKCFKCRFCITPYHTVCTLYERDTVSDKKPDFCKATHVTIHTANVVKENEDTATVVSNDNSLKLKIKK